MSSFISIDGEHGFWTNNGLYELLMWMLALQLEPAFKTDSVAARILAQWFSVGKTQLSGCTWDDLQEFSQDPEAMTVIRGASERLRLQIEAAPDNISPDFLNLCGLPGGRWVNPLPKRFLTVFIAAWFDLLDGKVDTTAANAAHINIHTVQWPPC